MKKRGFETCCYLRFLWKTELYRNKTQVLPFWSQDPYNWYVVVVYNNQQCFVFQIQMLTTSCRILILSSVLNKFFVFSSIQSRSKAKHYFFSFLSGLAEWTQKFKLFHTTRSWTNLERVTLATLTLLTYYFSLLNSYRL